MLNPLHGAMNALRPVEIGELQKGDVLLSRGTGMYGTIINYIDLSIYTHAALYCGEDLVIEAVPHAVVCWELRQSVNADHRSYVHVYRLRGADEATRQKIVDCALAYKGTPYAWTDVLYMLHKLPGMPGSLDELRPQLWSLMADLRAYEGLGRLRGMTCSELVAQAFVDAGRPLQIDLPTKDGVRSASPQGTPSTPSTSSATAHADPDVAELMALCERLLRRELERKDDPFRSAVAALDGRDLHLVSPKHISHSASLEPIGILKRTQEILSAPTPSPPKPTKPPAMGTSEAPRRGAQFPFVAVPSEEKSPQDEIHKQRFVFFAAGAGQHAQYDDAGELMAIRNAFRRSKFRDHFDASLPALRAGALDLADTLDFETPTMVHFAGHAREEGLVALDKTIVPEHLRSIFGHHATRIQLVVLNACNTAALAEELAQHVSIVIGMNAEIRDSEATKFAAALYLAIGNGRDVQSAFDLARRELSDPGLPTLAAKRVDPSAVRLIGPIFTGAAKKRWKRAGWLTFAGVVAAGFVLVAAKHPGQEEREVRPSEVARIAPGVLHPGSSEADARAAYARCVDAEGANAAEACRPSFEASVFAREVDPTAAISIPAFEIDRVEVSGAQLAKWLDDQAARFRIEADSKELERLHLPGASVMLGDEWVAGVALDGLASNAAVSIAHGEHGYRAIAGHGQEPARVVSWRGAQLYCESLKRRLPTSYEWEWAARGAAGRVFPWGNQPPKDCDAVIYGRRPGQPCENRVKAPAAVGTSEDVTPEGVYDLGGNVSEWVDTDFAADNDVIKVVRGGHFQDAVPMLGAARRFRGHRSEIYRQLGFRCARSVE